LKTLTQEKVHRFLEGGGEMGERTRNYDWSKSTLGLPEQWPQSLRTTVSNLLRSKFPMFLWWGEEMIQFYNDAYRPSLGNEGKHPLALGQKGKECWPEIWETVYPLMQQVQTTGEAVWREDQLVPIYRNGKLEDVYWTFSYSSVLDEEGCHAGILVTCMETTEKVQNQNKVFESERNFRNMILQAPVAMCILIGPEHIIDIVNEMMIELWGKTAASVMHKPIFEALPDAKEQGLEQLLADVYHTGVAVKANERPVDLVRNGRLETVYQNFVYEPYRNVDGTILGVLAISVDVTEQVFARRKIEEIVSERTRELAKANEALVKGNQELARSNMNLEEFAYAASHDLKEPIRKIHFFAERIKSTLRERMTEGEKQSFERMEVAAKRMNALIDDLLMYSQVSIRPRSFETVNLNTLIEMVLSDLDLEIEQKEAKINLQVLGTIQGHQRQLQQAFQNLIGNALKYSNPITKPEITIESTQIKGKDTGLHLSPEEHNRPYCVIAVSDNGIGFEQKDAERIFNVFTRLHGNAEYRGTGVGLSIVRKVIENHNGYITAESEPAKGAIFKVYLPIADKKQG
jgi:PAS domain S-box-containing protein